MRGVSLLMPFMNHKVFKLYFMRHYYNYSNQHLWLFSDTREPAISNHNLLHMKGSLSKSFEKRSLVVFIIVLIAAIFFSLPSFGQATTEDWKLLQTTDNVSFSYTIGTCNGEGRYLLLKIDNQNSNTVHVSWTIVVTEGEKTIHFPGMLNMLANGKTEIISCKTIDPHTFPMPLTDDFLSPQVSIEPRIEAVQF